MSRLFSLNRVHRLAPSRERCFSGQLIMQVTEA